MKHIQEITYVQKVQLYKMSDGLSNVSMIEWMKKSRKNFY